MAKILVIGDDLRSFLAIVRSLAGGGHSVHCLSDTRRSVAFASRYIAKRHFLMSASVDLAAWLDGVAALSSREAYDLIIPCTDATLVPLLECDHSIDPDKIAAPGAEAYRIFNDKLLTKELSQRLGIPVSECFDVTEQLLSFPLYLKPKSSISPAHLHAKRKVVRVESKNQLADQLRYIDAKDEYFLEQPFSGVGIGVSVLANKGEVTHAFQHERISDADASGSSLRCSVALNTELLDCVKQLAAASELHGVAMFEFRYNKQANTFSLLEVNARFWGSLPLATYCGVDFPNLLVQLYSNPKNMDAFNQYSTGLVGRAFTQSLYDFQRDIREFSLANRAVLITYHCSTAIFMSLIGRQKIDTFAWCDPKPFLLECAGIGREIGAKVLKIVGLMPPIRGVMARQKLANICGPIQSVMVICHGNICRSPFMAHKIKALINNDAVRVHSSGFVSTIGRASPEKAVTVARQYGVKLQDHSSSCVHNENLNEVDLIIYFDQRNKHSIASLYPELLDKAICAGDFDILRTDLDDPYGQDVSAFNRCYQRIEQASLNIVSAIVDRLAKPNQS